jgi:uncharacterized protein
MTDPGPAGGHYVVIDGSRWRGTDTDEAAEHRLALVDDLMAARREVIAAQDAGDARGLEVARRRVQRAKAALGERGWWEAVQGV